MSSNFEQFVEEVKRIANENIVDIIGEYLPLKRVGTSYKCNCPFHPDKTPSFSVSPSRGIWKCFGCGKGGDAIKFLMEYENIDFNQAIRKIAQKFNIPTPPHSEKLNQKNLALFEVEQFYYQNLLKNPQAKKFLLEDRKIPARIIEEFKLGYAPKDSSLVKYAQEKGILEELTKLGHIRKKYSLYDILRDRVVIPVRDIKGNVIGFTGRVIESGKEPKYLHTPYMEKRKVLFGLDKALPMARDKKYLIITEGVFDVLRMHSLGISNAVATLGAGLSKEQIELLKSLQKKGVIKAVVLAFDNDKAGRQATLKSLEMLFQEGITGVYLLKIPQPFKDLDEFGLNNSKLLRENLKKALEEPLIYKFAKAVSQTYKPEEIADKLKLVREIVFSCPDKTQAKLIWQNIKSILYGKIDKKVQVREKLAKIRKEDSKTLEILFKAVKYAEEKGWIDNAEYEFYTEIAPEIAKVSLNEDDKAIGDEYWRGFLTFFRNITDYMIFMEKQTLPNAISRKENQIIKTLKKTKKPNLK